MNLKKEEIIKGFDPNSPGEYGKLFGLPFEPEQAQIIIIPVPWEVTVSYGSGTASGPEEILMASSQVDLHTFDIEDAWKLGVCLDTIDRELQKSNNIFRELAENYINSLEGRSAVENPEQVLERINSACEEMVQFVFKRSSHYLNQSKIVGVLGGDHSSPLGLIHALGEKHDSFGILQIDAHADLRNSYEGFTFSHASIMYNALKNRYIEKLVQVGIRDYCEEEAQFIEESQGRIRTFLYPEFKENSFTGVTFASQVEDIVNELPNKVYISFDIDGLDPSLCPNTGTPVPGGLLFEEARYIIKKVVSSGREIIGFDLCEVSSSDSDDSEWDANVGARVLYNLINYTGVSNGLINWNQKSIPDH